MLKTGNDLVTQLQSELHRERRERERERGEATVDMKKHSLDQTCSPQVSTEVMDRQRKDKQQV